MRKTLIFVAIPAFAWLAADPASAATVPAGTTLVVRTLQTISSQDIPGTHFPAQLENNVVVNGNVVLRAGTKLSGRVETARRTHHSSDRLTVDITEANLGGRAVPIKTTGAVQLDNTRFKTRHDVSVSRGAYQVAAGRTIQFRLAQPLRF